jgi:hypothetical protein
MARQEHSATGWEIQGHPCQIFDKGRLIFPALWRKRTK